MNTEHPLIAARKQADLTRNQLADLVNSTRVTIWRIETWQANPSMELVSQIIGALRAKKVALSADAFIPSHPIVSRSPAPQTAEAS